MLLGGSYNRDTPCPSSCLALGIHCILVCLLLVALVLLHCVVKEERILALVLIIELWYVAKDVQVCIERFMERFGGSLCRPSRKWLLFHCVYR